MPLRAEFDNPDRFAMLCGEYDRNLARIEQALDVTIVPRGNQLSISGAGAECQIARRAIGALYDRAEQGLEIGIGDVDGAVRLASADPAPEEPATTGTEPVRGEIIRTPKRHITARSPNQMAYMRALREKELVFGLGPAGTGKTYLAVAAGVAQLLAGKVDRIVLCRPAVEAGEQLGFLPGDLREKIDPYLRPLYDALHDMMPGEQVNKRLASGEIEIAPLAFMRGRTLSNAFVIVDEGQNTTRMQMKMILTRLGENSAMAVTGDPSQIDLPDGISSGLVEAERILSGVNEIEFIRFNDRDVVRHALVTRIVQAYDADDSRARSGQRRNAEPI